MRMCIFMCIHGNDYYLYIFCIASTFLFEYILMVKKKVSIATYQIYSLASLNANIIVFVPRKLI